MYFYVFSLCMCICDTSKTYAATNFSIWGGRSKFSWNRKKRKSCFVENNNRFAVLFSSAQLSQLTIYKPLRCGYEPNREHVQHCCIFKPFSSSLHLWFFVWVIFTFVKFLYVLIHCSFVRLMNSVCVCTALSVAAFREFKILCFVCLRDSYFPFLPSPLEWHDFVNRVCFPR